MFGLNRYQIWCLVYITFGSTFYGYDSGITTSVIAYPNFLKYFNLNAVTIGAFNSVYYAACAIGCFLNWYFPDRFGRLRTIQIFCVNSVIAIVLQTAAQNFGMFVAGRVLGGFSCGVIYALCPTYAAEVSPPKIRGRVGMVYALNISVGYFITEWLGLGFYFIPGEASWRVLFGLQALPTILMFVGSFWMPESPRWLALKGRYDETIHVLQRIHEGVRHDDDPDFYLREFHQIKAQIELDKEEQLGLRDIFRRPSYRRRCILVICFSLFQQLTGIIPLQNYQVILYGLAGLDEVQTLILVGAWGTWVVIAVAVLSPWIDRIGRRNIVFISFSFIILGSLITVTTWARFEAGGGTDIPLGAGIIVGMFVLVFGYGGVLNTFVPVYSAEIMPTCIRAAGVSLGYATFNIIVICLVQVTPLAIERISWRYFLIFLICDCIFIVAFYFFYPETKGKTLEEIEAVFGDRIAVTIEEAGDNARAEKGIDVEQKEVA